MRQKLFFAGIVLLLLPLVAGCGVSQDLYDSAVLELGKAKAEVQSARTVLEAAEAEVAELTPALEKAQAELEAVQEEVAELKARVEKAEADSVVLADEKKTLKSQLATIRGELDEIKKVYPPRDFNSRMELEDWLLTNDVSEKPVTPDAEGWYNRALEVQADALADGYVVSVDYDADEEGVSVFCTTVIGGDIWYWDPETDEVFQDLYLMGVK